MQVIEYSEQSKQTEELRRQNKIYFIVNAIFGGVFLIGALFSLFWGSQYLYGSLIGLLGLATSVIMNTFFFRNFKKGIVGRSWMIFFFRMGVSATLIMVPLFTSNSWNNPSGGVSLVYTPINVWAIIIFLSIPLFSSFVSSHWMGKEKKIIKNKIYSN